VSLLAVNLGLNLVFTINEAQKNIGCWLLAAGYWLLAIGLLLLPAWPGLLLLPVGQLATPSTACNPPGTTRVTGMAWHGMV
jgi:hypothetical protein